MTVPRESAGLVRERDFLRRLDWNLLKVFLAIVDAGGVSRACAPLRRGQPAVSQALRRLEDDLGVRLCERGPAGFRLTDEGRLLADVCRSLAQLVGDIPNEIADASSEVRGRVRIQLISNIVDRHLDEAIEVFHRGYPLVEIVIDVATWDSVNRSLLRNEIEVGIAPARFKHAELRYEPLLREVHQAFCGRGHPLFGQHLADPAALAGQRFILTGADEPDELTRFRLRHGLGEHIAGVSEYLEEAKRLTLIGVGVCFLPVAYAAPEVAAGKLCCLLDPASGPSMEIFVITNPKAPPQRARERFLDALRRSVAADRSAAADAVPPA